MGSGETDQTILPPTDIGRYFNIIGPPRDCQTGFNKRSRSVTWVMTYHTWSPAIVHRLDRRLDSPIRFLGRLGRYSGY